MYIAMNRFSIKPGWEAEFESIWRERETHLHEVPGFREFALLKGPSYDDFTLYATHTVWDSYDAFDGWTKSEQFRKAHAGAGSARDIYMGPPQLEGFTAVQVIDRTGRKVEETPHPDENKPVTPGGP